MQRIVCSTYACQSPKYVPVSGSGSGCGLCLLLVQGIMLLQTALHRPLASGGITCEIQRFQASYGRQRRGNSARDAISLEKKGLQA